jgi:RNA polymerase sigma-70 factor (ECF subfamily)
VVDDARLLDRARRGDEHAFSQLFAAHQRSIFRYAAYMCGTDAADDVVQDTFLAVLRQSSRHDAPAGTIGLYLFGIARHLVLKRLGLRREELVEDIGTVSDALVAEDARVLDDLSRAETIETVRAAVRSLSPAYREVIVLCELQEIGYVEAAALIECPIGTVRSRLHRARALLMTRLAQSPLRQELEVRR